MRNISDRLNCTKGCILLHFSASKQILDYDKYISVYSMQTLTLSQVYVTNGHIDVFLDRIATVDHESVSKFHWLGPLSSKFSRHDDLATFGSTLHDESHDTITSPVRVRVGVRVFFLRHTNSRNKYKPQEKHIIYTTNCNSLPQCESYWYLRKYYNGIRGRMWSGRIYQVYLF